MLRIDSKNKCMVGKILLRLRKQIDGGKIFSKILPVPDEWRERLSFGAVHA